MYGAHTKHRDLNLTSPLKKVRRQCTIIVLATLVDLSSPMIVQRFSPKASSFMEKICKDFYHIWAWRPSSSTDRDHFSKLSFPQAKGAHFTSDVYYNHNLWSCQTVCDALIYLLDNIFIRFGTKLYRQTIGIPMGTNCAPLVADLFLFCYERDFMKSLLRENQADIFEAFNSTRYLDNLLNIDNIYFDQMVDRIYPTELQLNRANSSDTEAPFWI